MVVNDYQKKLIAEGFYARLMEESAPDKRVLLVLEFMEAMTPKSTFPILQEGAEFGLPRTKWMKYLNWRRICNVYYD